METEEEKFLATLVILIKRFIVVFILLLVHAASRWGKTNLFSRSGAGKRFSLHAAR